jgi:hypothetical protein
VSWRGQLIAVGLAVGLVLSAAVAWLRVTEAQDIKTVRAAAARICARDNRERAEAHFAYRQSEEDLRRVERNLPVVDCSANLYGRPAQARSRQGQRRFTCLYATDQLRPLPGPKALPGLEPDHKGLCDAVGIRRIFPRAYR